MKIVSNKPTITRKEIEGVLNCLVNGELIAGESVKNFESSISMLTGQKYSVAVNSLTSAYHLAFIALDIKKDDEIIIPSFYDLAPLGALSLIGATPVLVDIADNSFSSSIDQIKEKITDKTKAIIISHTFGFPVALNELSELNIPVIEDISHIIGVQNDEKLYGNFAIAIASFAPGGLITTGNGGILLTNNSKFFSVMRDFRGSGKTQSIHFDYSLTDFQAAMGLMQLSRIKAFIKRRQDIARTYYEALKFSQHKTVYHYSDNFSYQSFPIIFDAPADKVEAYWKKNGMEIQKPIPFSLHKILNLKPMDYPNSDRFANKLYSLPIYPTLTKKEIDKVYKTLAKFI